MKRRGTEKRRTIPPLSPSRYRKEEETQKGGPGGKVPRRVRAEPCPKSDADFSRRRRPRLEISRHPKVLSETLQRSRFQVRLRLWVPHHVGLADQRQKLEGATRREERLDELEAVQVESFSGRAALDKKVPQGWSALGQDLLTRDLAGARPVDKSEPFQLRGLASAALRKASNLFVGSRAARPPNRHIGMATRWALTFCQTFQFWRRPCLAPCHQEIRYYFRAVIRYFVTTLDPEEGIRGVSKFARHSPGPGPPLKQSLTLRGVLH